MPIFPFRAKQEARPLNFSDRTGHPGTPRGDTLHLSPLLALCPSFLQMQDGSFVVMLEIPPLYPGVGGGQFASWMARYEASLARLPAGSHFQVSILPQAVDPEGDLAYFVEAARAWRLSASRESASDRRRGAAQSLAVAAEQMTAALAGLYDTLRPMRWRMILTLSERGDVLPERKHGWGQKAASPSSPRGQKEAAERLEQRVSLLEHIFASASLPLRVLSPGEMAQALWLGLHPAVSGAPGAAAMALDLARGDAPSACSAPPPEAFSPLQSTEELAELLAPDTVVERENELEVDGVHLRGYILHDFKPYQPALLYRLSELEGGWLGALYVEVADPQALTAQLDARAVQVDAGRWMRASKGFLENYTAEMEAQAVKETRQALAAQGQGPILVRLFVMRTAPNAETLERRARDLESLLTTLGVRFYPARYRQGPLWQSVLPTGVMKLGQAGRNLTAASLAPFFWPPRARLSDDRGLYIGVDEDSGLPVRLDPFGEQAERTPSVLTLGRPGAGKSVTLRTVMLSGLIHGATVMAVDLEGEMRDFCQKYGGRYIEIGVKGGDRINILDIPPDREDPLSAGTEHLVAFCSAVRGAEIPPGAEWNALAESYRLALIDRGYLTADGEVAKGETWDTANAPRLRDIVRILERQGSTGSSLAEVLRPYGEGVYAPYFDHLTTFELAEERLVVFSLKQVNLNDTAARLRVYLWQVMGLIWGEMVRRHEQNPEGFGMVMLDELWAILGAPGGAEAIENMARRFRKRRAVLWMATQQTGEFLSTSAGRRILNIVGNTFLMEQRPSEARALQPLFDLSDELARHLEVTGTGRGLWIHPGSALRVHIAVPTGWGVI